MAGINGNLAVSGYVALAEATLPTTTLVPTLANVGGKAVIRMGSTDTTLGELAALVQDVNADGYVLQNLGLPVNPTDSVRLIDVENLLAGRDYQPDVASILNDGDTPVADQRYIVGTYVVAGANANDIVLYDGADFTLAYDVSERGPGALAYSVEDATFLRWNGTNWAVFQGGSDLTNGSGLTLTGNVLAVDTTVIATVSDLTTVSNALTDLGTAVNERIDGLFGEHVSGAAATTHTVTHALDTRYPVVQVVDAATNQVIIPDSVEFTSATQFVVTLGVAADVIISYTGSKAAA